MVGRYDKYGNGGDSLEDVLFKDLDLEPESVLRIFPIMKAEDVARSIVAACDRSLSTLDSFRI
jgi:hypothetical protein